MIINSISARDSVASDGEEERMIKIRIRKRIKSTMRIMSRILFGGYASYS